MNNDTFNEVLTAQIDRSTSVLISKAKEYASETDRLANFKVAAALQNITPSQALAGMMAKHTQSVYAMIQTGEAYTTEMWNEKITDHINYLLLLRAVVEEEHNVGSIQQVPLAPWEIELMNASEEKDEVSNPDAPNPDTYTIQFGTRDEGRRVIEALKAAIENFGEFSIADLRDLSRLRSDFVHTKWGWKSLVSLIYKANEGGFQLSLGNPVWTPSPTIRIPLKGEL